MSWRSCLPPETYAPEGIEFYGQVNFLKAGIVYADVINTVSQRYSQEIQTEEFGCGLDGILRYRGQDVYGILNGIDDREWNPSTDRLIAARYSKTDLSGKQMCKRDLLATFGLPPSGAPVVGMVSRLVDPKGFDLLENAMQRLLALDRGRAGNRRGPLRSFLPASERYPTKWGCASALTTRWPTRSRPAVTSSSSVTVRALWPESDVQPALRYCPHSPGHRRVR